MTLLTSGLYLSDWRNLVERLPDQSIDLIYIDPTWNFKTEFYDGDTGKEANLNYMQFMHRVIRRCKKALVPTGSLLLHITPETGVYVRPALDEIFDQESYRPEITIPRKIRPDANPNKSQPAHEIILHYTASEDYTYNPIIHKLTEAEALENRYEPDENGQLYRRISLIAPQSQSERPNLHFEFRGHTATWRYPRARLLELDAEGRIGQKSPDSKPFLKRYLDEHPGRNTTSDWQDMPLYEMKRHTREFVGQRSMQLMEKLLQITTNEGDMVLDPFCGTGTTLIAAQNHNRRWIGADNEPAAYAIAQERLQKECDLSNTDYQTGDQAFLDKFEIVRSAATPRFFISYSRRDEVEFVRPFLAELDKELISYWFDKRDIEIGTAWLDQLKQSIATHPAMILFITPDSMDSKYVQEEYKGFLGAGKPIYPLLCRPTEDIPKALASIQWYEYTERDRLLNELIRLSI